MSETKKTRTLPLDKQVAKLRDQRAAAVALVADIDSKLPALEAELASVTAEAEARKDIDVTGLPEGTKVAFNYGRGESRKELTGRTVAFRAKSNAADAAYKVETGEGFDVTVVTVFARDVLRTVPAI